MLSNLNILESKVRPNPTKTPYHSGLVIDFLPNGKTHPELTLETLTKLFQYYLRQLNWI